MGTLAYDPDRLQMLATALADAADALDAVHATDADAQSALATASAASGSFRSWVQWIADLQACRVLGEYQPTAPDIANLDLALDVVLVSLYQWRATTDPTGATWSVPATEQAAALGYVLSQGLPPLESPDDRARLLAQLQAAAADPAALAALRANLSVEGLAALADALASGRSQQVARGGGPYMPIDALDTAAEVRESDAMLAALATVLYDPTKPIGAAQATLDAMRPYTAASVLAQLHAPEDAYVTLATDAFHRYWISAGDFEHGPLASEIGDADTPGIGDLLFPRITALSAGAANRFAADVAHIDPQLLTMTAVDPLTSTALLMRATDPAFVDEDDAGRVIVPLVDSLRDPGLGRAVTWSPAIGEAVNTLTANLGTILAPWMLAMTRDTAGALGWDDDGRDRALLFVLGNDRARTELLALTDRWLAALPIAEPTNDPNELQNRIDVVAGSLGQLLGLIEQHVTDEAEAAQARWNLATSIVPRGLAIPIGFVPGVGTAGRIVINAAAFTVAEVAKRGIIPGGPASVAEVVGAVQRSTDVAMATGSYLAMVSMRALLIDIGALPPDTEEVPPPWDDAGCPSSDYESHAAKWVDKRIPEGLRAEMDNARRAFIGPGSGQLTCQRLDG